MSTTRRVLIPHTVQDRPPATADAVHELTGHTMGTTWRVRVSARPQLHRGALIAGIRSRLDAVVDQMSTWEPESALCRFNRSPIGTWQPLPAAFCEVLGQALAVACLSDGAFDPTVGPLVDAWGFGPDGTPALPRDADLEAARSRGDRRGIEFDAAGRRARRTADVALDFSAIAKGYAVDRVSAFLDASGLGAHLVEVGGELRGSGVKPDGQPWWVTLESPEAGATEEILVALNGLAVATSGDYRRWFAHQGRRYAHTIDPRRGRPIEHALASVSVLHADCMAADAWSTALTVMGVEAGIACADRLGIAARFVVRLADGWDERLSAACAAMQA